MSEPIQIVQLEVPLVHITDHCNGESSTCLPGVWIDRAYDTILARALGVQSRNAGDFLLSGTPEEGAVVVTDPSGTVVVNVSWATKTAMQACGFEP